MTDQEATAAAIGGIVVPKSFEDLIHEAYQEMISEDEKDDGD